MRVCEVGMGVHIVWVYIVCMCVCVRLVWECVLCGCIHVLCVCVISLCMCVRETESDSSRVGSSPAECFVRQYVRVTGPDEKVDMVRPIIREESVLRYRLCDGNTIPPDCCNVVLLMVM